MNHNADPTCGEWKTTGCYVFTAAHLGTSLAIVAAKSIKRRLAAGQQPNLDTATLTTPALFSHPGTAVVRHLSHILPVVAQFLRLTMLLLPRTPN